MIIDRNTRVSSAQAVTATAVSTDTYDLGTARDIGAGNDMEFVCRVVTAFTAGGAATLTVSLITSANADLSSATTVVSSAAIPVASLTAGLEILRIRVPVNQMSRYIGASYTVATGPMTAGALTTAIIVDRQADAYYPSGVPVSGY